jgi:hypothetical protein
MVTAFATFHAVIFSLKGLRIEPHELPSNGIVLSESNTRVKLVMSDTSQVPIGYPYVVAENVAFDVEFAM